MQVFRCRELIHLNIICVQMETVLSLIRANWMLWLVGAGSKLALLVAALLPRGGVSWSVRDIVLSVGDKQYEMLRYVCVMVWDVSEVSSRQVLCVGGVVFIGRRGWVCCNTCCEAFLCCVFEVAGVVLGRVRGVVLAGF
jgi:hypothetical protein